MEMIECGGMIRFQKSWNNYKKMDIELLYLLIKEIFKKELFMQTL